MPKLTITVVHNALQSKWAASSSETTGLVTTNLYINAYHSEWVMLPNFMSLDQHNLYVIAPLWCNIKNLG